MAGQHALEGNAPRLHNGQIAAWPPAVVESTEEYPEQLQPQPEEGGGSALRTIADELVAEVAIAEETANDGLLADELTEELVIEELVIEEPVTKAATDDSVPKGSLLEDLLLEEPTVEEASLELTPETGDTDAVAETGTEDPAWPFGERRSAARQARRPLPAALQEAVAAGAAQDLSEATPHSHPGQASQHSDAKRGGSGNTTVATTHDGENRGSSRSPGILRRYGSAIIIVVLFLAAGGVAAGIAAFRGPVVPPAQSTVAQDKAAANSAVLSAADFPAAWRASGATSPASSFGLGSALVTPAIVQAWLVDNRACTTDLEAVSAAMTPNVGSVTAVAYSQASTTNPLGGPWQIADAIAFHTTAVQVGTDLAKMRAELAKQNVRKCVARFWSETIQAQLPINSLVVVTVSPRAVPPLPGKPPGWAMEMTGTATVNGTSTPLRCQVTSFGAGRAQVFFVVSSKAAALPANIAQRALLALATRTERLAASAV